MNAHFNSYKAKYGFLDSIFRPILSVNRINTMNLFINLDDILHILHKPLINNEFLAYGDDASKQLLSNIFNIIAHYKGWIIRQGIKCNCIIYYTTSKTRFKNAIYVPKYRDHYSQINDKMHTSYYYINAAIRESLPLISVISNYIEKVYALDSSYIEPSVIPFYISNEIFKADWNLLISRDIYDFQYSYIGNWTVISAKGDFTTDINAGNMWNIIKEKNKINNLDIHNYPPSILPLAIAIVGDRFREIKSIKKIGWKTFFKYVESIYEEEGTSDISKDILEVSLCDKIFIKSKDNTAANNLNNNIQAVSIKTQYNNMGDIDKTMIIHQIKDIPDIENFQMLNKIYFTKYPININNLTKQVYVPNKPKLSWNK